jgi:hypothetical protein
MRSTSLIATLGALLLAVEAHAQPTFSVDFQGPTPGAAGGFGFGVITEGDILTTPLPLAPGPNAPVPGPFAIAPGIEIGAAPLAPGAVAGGLGILPALGGVVELDALSYGRDVGSQVHFSVDEFAFGLPAAAPSVFTEGAGGLTGASADVWMYLGPFMTIPPGVGGPGHTQAVDGNGIGPSALPGIALIEPGAPTVGILPDAGDNLDAVDMDTTFADLTGPVYFSLDSLFPDPLEVPPANAGTAAALGFSGADVLVSMAGGVPAIAIPAAVMGLDLGGAGTDDLDALIYNDADLSGGFSAGDSVYFSVRRGSAVIGVADSFYGVPIEEGDVLTLPTAAGAPPAIFIPGEVMGLATARSGMPGGFGPDDLNALDVIGPVSVPSLSAPGLGMLVVGMCALTVLGMAFRRSH